MIKLYLLLAIQQYLSSVSFLTRISVPKKCLPNNFQSLIETSWAFPLVGGLIGALSGLAFMSAAWLGMPSILSSLAALLSMLIITGGLHEDGLADIFDGIGSGKGPERIMEIIRDSRLGSHGVLALYISISARWTLINLLDLNSLKQAVMALATVCCISRSWLTFGLFLMYKLNDNSLDTFHQNSLIRKYEIGYKQVIISISFGLLASIIMGNLLIMILPTIGALLFFIAIRRKVPGFSGDLMGASQQIAEIIALIAVYRFA